MLEYMRTYVVKCLQTGSSSQLDWEMVMLHSRPSTHV